MYAYLGLSYLDQLKARLIFSNKLNEMWPFV